jgi:glycosyltransferase involved in cell wall biosynthesis
LHPGSNQPLQPLTIVETHPVQYHAPVYRAVHDQDVPVVVIYGSDFSTSGYRDDEFGVEFAWDTDLLRGYESRFLSRVSAGGARSFHEVSARGLQAALRETKDGPILLLGYNAGFNRAAFFHAWRSRRPVLFRPEAADHARDRNMARSFVRDQALRRVYAACARLLYIGMESARHYKRLGVPAEKLMSSPYCVDASCFRWDERARKELRAHTRSQLGIDPSALVLLFSGKLSQRKGVDLIVPAAQRLGSSFRAPVVAAFVGSGELQGALEAQAATCAAASVRFCGFRNQTELSAYYHSADLLVLPSRHSETWGLVVNEALHHGLPCVVSQAVGCAPDLIEPSVTGEIAETDSVESLAAAICRAVPLVGRAELRHACRERVGGYTVEKAADGIAQAYRAVVS